MPPVSDLVILLVNSCLRWNCHIGFTSWLIYNISTLLQVSQRTALRHFDSCTSTFFQSSLRLFCIISTSKSMSLAFLNDCWSFRNYLTYEFLKAFVPYKQYPNSYYGMEGSLTKSRLFGQQFPALQIENATTLPRFCYRVYHQRMCESNSKLQD